MLRQLLGAGSWSLRIGCAVHFIDHNLYEVSESSGESMLPTLSYSGDYAHVNKLCRFGRGCSVGDVVVVAKPNNPEQRVCKRITGMAGDAVFGDPTEPDSPLIKVPVGHVWVTGDNIPHSIDSRKYGPVALGLVKGKVVAAHSLTGFRLIPNNLELAEPASA